MAVAKLCRIDALIRRAEDRFKMLCAPSPWSSLDEGPRPFHANFPWLEFIMICVDYQIDCVLPADVSSFKSLYFINLVFDHFISVFS